MQVHVCAETEHPMQLIYSKCSEIFTVNSENTAVNTPSGASMEHTFVSVVVTVLFPGTVLLVCTVLLLL